MESSAVIEVNRFMLDRSSRGVKRYYSELAGPLAQNFQLVDSPSRKGKIQSRLSEAFYVGSKTGIFWSPSHSGSLIAHNQVVTVHDSIAIEYIYQGWPYLPLYRSMLARILDVSAGIVFISHATRDSFFRLFDLDANKCHVIQSGFPKVSFHPCGAPESAPSGARERYVLSVTNFLPHKNTLTLCDAFLRSRLLGAGWRLTVVGSVSAEAQELIARKDIPVEILSSVDDSRLTDLYAGAGAYVSPSLLEGHNFTIAEALMCGAPVIASDIAAHREFYDGRVTFFDPADAAELAACLDGVCVGAAGVRKQDFSGVRTFEHVAADYVDYFTTLTLGAK